MAEMNLPGYGGLQRFKEEYKSKLQISPIAVVGMVIATIIIEILLHKFGV